MWIKQIFLGIVGISCGFAVAGGLFALFIALTAVKSVKKAGLSEE